MALYKRPNSPYWWYSFKLPGRPQICGTTKTADRKLANAIYLKIRTEALERKTLKKPSRMTVDELLNWCLEYHWSHSAWAHAFQHRLKPIREFFGEMIAESVNVEDILRYRKTRLAEGIAKSTVNRDLTWLRAAYNYAIDNETLVNNPVEKVKFFDESERKRERFLNQKEKDKLLSGSRGVLHHIIFFAMKSGMRQGEILNLRWRDVDLERGHMKVLSRKGNKVTIRYVPIFDQIYDLLTRLPKYGENVFSYPDGRRLSRMGVVHSSFMRLADRLQISNFVFHDLRHTFASDFLSKGGTLSELAKIMGHSTTTMTERYGHLSKEHLTAAIKVLPREKYYKFTTLTKKRVSNPSKVVDNHLLPR